MKRVALIVIFLLLAILFAHSTPVEFAPGTPAVATEASHVSPATLSDKTPQNKAQYHANAIVVPEPESINLVAAALLLLPLRLGPSKAKKN